MRAFFLVLLFYTLSPPNSSGDSWQSTLKSKSAQLYVRWNESKPFIQYDAEGNLIGLEFEMIGLFADYLKQKHDIELTVDWIKENQFYEIMENVSSADQNNVFGAAAFSVTKERQSYLRFTDTYLPDITVLVSSQGTPIVRNFDEIHQMMQGMQGLTIKGTIYETFLLKMRDQINVDFEIKYIDSDDNILEHISNADNRFGFVDLPIYLIWIKDGKQLNRQNFFTVRGLGYGFIMPQSSDWHIPFNQFLADEMYKPRIDQVIAKYLGDELYQFINDSFGREQLSTYILTKEKEIQLALIKNANLNLEKEITYKKLSIAGTILVLIFLIIVGFFFRKNQKKTNLIIEQKNQIENHQKDIRKKNEQLMNRNAQLLALNEDKNNLVNILAHDLRSPLSQILGLSGILEAGEASLSQESKGYLEKISDAANRMNQMIAKILDVGTLDRNQNTVLKEQVDVTQLIHDLTARYQPLATNKSITLDIQLPNYPVSLETDHMLLFLVLENLLSNAVKFSDPDTHIKFQVTDENDQLLFKITDEGPGFTEEDKSLVFNRFQKLSAQPTGGETSTGLGLSIVKKYVTDLGGEVWLESTLGKGSTFFVSLKTRTLSSQET